MKKGYKMYRYLVSDMDGSYPHICMVKATSKWHAESLIYKRGYKPIRPVDDVFEHNDKYIPRHDVRIG